MKEYIYPAIFHKNNDGSFTVIFPDLPGCITEDKTMGNALREPYTKHLDDGIFELRCKLGKNLTRTLYFFYTGSKIVLTNGFVKKTSKTPSNVIDLAKKYRADFISRQEESQ